MKAIVYKDPDHHTCAIIIPADQNKDIVEILNDHLRIAGTDEYPFKIENPRIINLPEDIPTDRLFRNAWTDEYDTSTVDIDLEKAKEIHIGRIREERNKLLDSSDKELARALDIGTEGEIAKVRSDRQYLRNIPQVLEEEIAKCDCPHKLKNIWPEELPLHHVYKEHAGRN